jgi:hypothetical protein
MKYAAQGRGVHDAIQPGRTIWLEMVTDQLAGRTIWLEMVTEYWAGRTIWLEMVTDHWPGRTIWLEMVTDHWAGRLATHGSNYKPLPGKNCTTGCNS